MLLTGRLDHVAVAASRHQAILHFAGSGEVSGEPQSDAENHGGNDQPDDGAAAVVAGLGLWRKLWRRLGRRLGLGGFRLSRKRVMPVLRLVSGRTLGAASVAPYEGHHNSAVFSGYEWIGWSSEFSST